MPKTSEDPQPIGVLISVPWDKDCIDLLTGDIVTHRYIMPVVNWWIGLEFTGVCHGAN